jgi:hypothetical protein
MFFRIQALRGIKPGPVYPPYYAALMAGPFYKYIQGLPKPREFKMAKKIFAGLLVITAVFGILAAGCKNDGGDPPITKPTEDPRNSYGITSDNKAVAIVFTPNSNDFVVKIDGETAATGTLEGGTATVTAVSGSTVTVAITVSDGGIGGVTVNGNAVTLADADTYYVIGGPISRSTTEQAFRDAIANKTLTEVYALGQNAFIETPETFDGTWEYIKALAGNNGVPESAFSPVAEELNKGATFAFGFYAPPGEDYNIIFCISKVPLPN